MVTATDVLEDPPGRATLFSSERTIVLQGTTDGNVPVYTQTFTTGDIEFDYSEHFDRAITALERIAIAIETIAEKQTVIADKQTLIEQHQAKLRSLGEDNGIHWRRPAEWEGGSATYGTHLERTDTDSTVSIWNISENASGG